MASATDAQVQGTWDRVRLRIRTSTQDVLRVELAPLSRLQDVKWALEQQTGVPARYMRLKKGGNADRPAEELSSAFDDDRIQDVGIQSGDQLLLELLPQAQRVSADATHRIARHLATTDAVLRSALHDNQLLRARVEQLEAVLREVQAASSTLVGSNSSGSSNTGFAPTPAYSVPVRQGTTEELMGILGTAFGSNAEAAAHHLNGRMMQEQDL
jgi:hypothetical protein